MEARDAKRSSSEALGIVGSDVVTGSVHRVAWRDRQALEIPCGGLLRGRMLLELDATRILVARKTKDGVIDNSGICIDVSNREPLVIPYQADSALWCSNSSVPLPSEAADSLSVVVSTNLVRI